MISPKVQFDRYSAQVGAIAHNGGRVSWRQAFSQFAVWLSRSYRVFLGGEMAVLLPLGKWFERELAPLRLHANASVSFIDDDGEEASVSPADLKGEALRIESDSGPLLLSSDDGIALKIVAPGGRIETLVPSGSRLLRHGLLREVHAPRTDASVEDLGDGYLIVSSDSIGNELLYNDRESARFYRVRFGVRDLHFTWVMSEEKSLEATLLDVTVLYAGGSASLWNTTSVERFSAVDETGPNGSLRAVRNANEDLLQLYERGGLVASACYSPDAFRSNGQTFGGWAVAYGDGKPASGSPGGNPRVLVGFVLLLLATLAAFVSNWAFVCVCSVWLAYGLWRTLS